MPDLSVGAHVLAGIDLAVEVNAVVQSCKIRLRPILMTSLATVLGMIPLAIGLEAGSEQYTPLDRAIIGDLSV